MAAPLTTRHMANKFAHVNVGVRSPSRLGCVMRFKTDLKKKKTDTPGVGTTTFSSAGSFELCSNTLKRRDLPSPFAPHSRPGVLAYVWLTADASVMA